MMVCFTGVAFWWQLTITIMKDTKAIQHSIFADRISYGNTGLFYCPAILEQAGKSIHLMDKESLLFYKNIE